MALAELYYRFFRGDKGIEVPLELQQAVARATDLEEMIQNNALQAAIQARVETLSDRDLTLLRGLWRGRTRAEAEKAKSSP